MKKVLVVGMLESIHTARAVAQLVDESQESLYKIYIVPGVRIIKPHPLLLELHKKSKIKILIPGLAFLPDGLMNYWILSLKVLYRIIPNFNKIAIWASIAILNPSLVHSMEIQGAGYATLGVRKRSKKKFKWLVTNWGSDIFLYSKLDTHNAMIKEILSLCDYYSCECSRDVELARQMGFKGEILPVLPNAGGIDFHEVDSMLREDIKRDRIMLKGYSGWAGRAIFALKALEKVDRELLKKFKITLYSWSAETLIAAKLFEEKVGMKIEVIPHNTSHSHMLRLFSESRIYIGLSISDGVSTSCLEAMAMGAFPIQSHSSCCMEWFIDGESGIAVDAEDFESVARAIEFGLRNDEEITTARKINFQICKEKLDAKKLKVEFVKNYQTCLGNS